VLNFYADDHHDHVPLGYTWNQKQTNYGLHWIGCGFSAMGRLYQAGYMGTPQIFYCPSQTMDMFKFNTSDNVWPPGTPGIPTRLGYSPRPTVTWGACLAPQRWDRLSQLSEVAILTDLAGAAYEVDAHHRTGYNVLFGDGASKWAPRRLTEPAIYQMTGAHNVAYNPVVDMIWDAFDSLR